MVVDPIFTARQVEIPLFGDYRKRVKVRLFTDSEVTLESIASSKQIDRKTLCKMDSVGSQGKNGGWRHKILLLASDSGYDGRLDDKGNEDSF